MAVFCARVLPRQNSSEAHGGRREHGSRLNPGDGELVATVATVARILETTRTTLKWSEDGTTVIKRSTSDYHDTILGSYRDALLNEIRVNRMLAGEPPPVPTPRLLGYSTRSRSLTVEAVEGKPLGPKFPVALGAGEVDELVTLAKRLEPYRPRRKWFRRFDIDRRLRRHVDEGLITAFDAQAVAALAACNPLRYRFAHGDVTARNVLREPTGRLVLIDWEWAGLYPTGYELAFLWLSLIDVPGGRESVENAVRPRDHAAFLVSAVLIQLLHLHLWLGSPRSEFAANHEDTLQTLLATVRSNTSTLAT